MTLQEFIETSPQSYGATIVNLLYSSSVSGSDDTPITPFTLQGITIPNSSQGTDLAATLKEVTEIKFDLTDGPVTATITGRQKRSGYFYFTFNDVVVNNIPSPDSLGISLFENSEFGFVPYLTLAFNNSDYNPLHNNSEGSKTNVVRKVVDRDASQAIPTNFDAIISGSAEAAELQNCSYTKTGILNSKYQGSKSTAANTNTGRIYHKLDFTNAVTSSAIAGNEPALSFIEFEGSLHPTDADATKIKAILQADRELIPLYFNSELSGSAGDQSFPSFPISGSFVYQDAEQGNRLVKVVNSSFFIVDTGLVYTTNENGGVIAEGS